MNKPEPVKAWAVVDHHGAVVCVEMLETAADRKCENKNIFQADLGRQARYRVVPVTITTEE